MGKLKEHNLTVVVVAHRIKIDSKAAVEQKSKVVFFAAVSVLVRCWCNWNRNAETDLLSVSVHCNNAALQSHHILFTSLEPALNNKYCISHCMFRHQYSLLFFVCLCYFAENAYPH